MAKSYKKKIQQQDFFIIILAIAFIINWIITVLVVIYEMKLGFTFRKSIISILELFAKN